MVFAGKSFNEISVGDTFGDRLTVTESHIVQGCGLFGDFNPLHTDEEFCKSTRFGERILHGPLTSALISASVGQFFSGTAVAYLEHNCAFKAPVKAGDTLSTQWTITEKILKEKLESGIAVMEAVCTNQHDIVVANANGKIMLTL
jgi:acyl dehydratase